MTDSYKDATLQEVDEALQKSWQAFQWYRQKNLKERPHFLYTIATELDAISGELLASAHHETHLEEARLKVELKRTIFQLTSYAQACEAGTWLDIRIDTADPNRNPPKPDLRKMLVPLGPVVVFGASNFPFAYSTAGGDTACALAAGCPVIVKAHPAHPQTSLLVANAIHKAIQKCHLPEGIFQHVYGNSFKVGEALVKHPLTKAVGFTGSYEGGKALFDWANSRQVPIPVFAEMGSVNPVFLLPEKVKAEASALADLLAKSITLSAGQFCTNPGIIIGIEDAALHEFKFQLSEKIKQVQPAKMLHSGIADNFHLKRKKVLEEKDVQVVAISNYQNNKEESLPTVAETTAINFLSNPVLHKEVFGPFSLLITCRNAGEMQEVAKAIEGQLTTTLIAKDEEVMANPALIQTLQGICGRFILNGVPTGVEVALAMHHGGPFPATTDSRFTAVGADGIKRFARPVCYQNWSNHLLPEELRNENPLKIWRTVNNALTKEAIE